MKFASVVNPACSDPLQTLPTLLPSLWSSANLLWVPGSPHPDHQKRFHRTGPSAESWGTPRCPSPAGCNSMSHQFLGSTIQSVYLGNWAPVQAMSSQFLSRMLLEIMSNAFLKPGKQYPQPLLYLLSGSCHRKRSGESSGTCIKHLSLFQLLCHYVSLHT